MSDKRLVMQVLLAAPREKSTKGKPRTRWHDYTSNLAWSCLGVEPAELSEIAETHGVSQVLLGLLPPQRS